MALSGLGTSSVQCLTINWSKSVLRQEETPEVLRCPAYSKCDADGVGYKTVTDNSMGFDRVGCLPQSTCKLEMIVWALGQLYGNTKPNVRIAIQQDKTSASREEEISH